MIHHSEELKDPLLTPGIRKAGIANDQVRVNLSVVPPDEEPPKIL